MNKENSKIVFNLVVIILLMIGFVGMLAIRPLRASRIYR